MKTDPVSETLFLVISNPDDGQSPKTQYLCVPILLQAYPLSTGTCSLSRSLEKTCSCLLRICCLAREVVPLSVSRPLPRNKCPFQSRSLAMAVSVLQSSCFERICKHIRVEPYVRIQLILLTVTFISIAILKLL
jgi:hypothetical protein